jgi:hypothetical protein
VSTKRFITVTLATTKVGFEVKLKEGETVTDDDSGQAHMEGESSSEPFALVAAAIEAAHASMKNFASKLPKPEGELFE